VTDIIITTMHFDQRRYPDRRRRNWKSFAYAIYKGRRGSPRRYEEQQQPHYIDIYEDPKTWLWLVGIIGFCALDAVLTLQIIDRGGVEVNPIMHFLLEMGLSAFFYTKYLATAAALIFIVMHINFTIRGIPIRRILPVIFSFYAILIAYECVLLFA